MVTLVTLGTGVVSYDYFSRIKHPRIMVTMVTLGTLTLYSFRMSPPFSSIPGTKVIIVTLGTLFYIIFFFPQKALNIGNNGNTCIFSVFKKHPGSKVTTIVT